MKPDNGRFFETQIAPFFTKHCLDCLDSVTKDGELELTQKPAALAGGGSGNAIGGVVNRSFPLHLWQFIPRATRAVIPSVCIIGVDEALGRWIKLQLPIDPTCNID